jgi:hypothetical protein
MGGDLGGGNLGDGTLGGTGCLFSSSMGHMVIMMATSGSTMSSQTLGKMILPSGPIKS